MILKCTARVVCEPANKGLAVSTLRQLHTIESETITKRSSSETLGRIRERLKLERRGLIDHSFCYISRWAERLMASSPRELFNFNTSGLAAFLQPDELNIVFREHLIAVVGGVLSEFTSIDHKHEESFKLLWKMRDDFVFVPSKVISNYGPRGIFDVTKGMLKNKWEFGVIGISGVSFSEEYSLDGSVKFSLIKNGCQFATLHFTGPVPRLPSVEEMNGF